MTSVVRNINRNFTRRKALTSLTISSTYTRDSTYTSGYSIYDCNITLGNIEVKLCPRSARNKPEYIELLVRSSNEKNSKPSTSVPIGSNTDRSTTRVAYFYPRAFEQNRFTLRSSHLAEEDAHGAEFATSRYCSARIFRQPRSCASVGPDVSLLSIPPLVFPCPSIAFHRDKL